LVEVIGLDKAKDEEELDAELKGNTLRVYLHVLKSPGKVGAREVQRALGFSSPTLAVHHLDKLTELGLVEKRDGEYSLARLVKVGVLKQFIVVSSFMLPRHFFYASMFSTLLILYVASLLCFEKASLSSIFALAFGIIGMVVSWYETIRVWREKK